VVVDEDNKTLQVIVPDDQLSLAIGRQGQNVRLASRLLAWRIDVYSETKYAKFMEDGYQSLTEIEGIDGKMADLLYENGISSAEELASAKQEDLTAIEGISVEKAARFGAAARVYLAEKKTADHPSGKAAGSAMTREEESQPEAVADKESVSE
jgi:transcription termination/antitermination protein NusA